MEIMLDKKIEAEQGHGEEEGGRRGRGQKLLNNLFCYRDVS